jgi:hypothetical protein
MEEGMKTSDELELDGAGYPDVEFEELDADTGSEEIELLMKCVGAARDCGV